ncbi:MAG: hypothetical protein COA78_16530 [Blastopirellula sp.]|nr:MAG: hypothetical protein COA78_16530 [Blastopirellula sp.]
MASSPMSAQRNKTAIALKLTIMQIVFMVNFVIPHDPAWKIAFDKEAKSISATLGDGFVSLHHIGSTSIGSVAKFLGAIKTWKIILFGVSLKLLKGNKWVVKAEKGLFYPAICSALE